MSNFTASELLEKWIMAMEKYDHDLIQDMYHDNAILLGTFSDVQRVGHKQIMEYLYNSSKSPIRVRVISKYVHEVNSIIMISGLYDFVINDQTTHARFSMVFSKDNTEYKILSHHSSVLPK